MNWKSTFTAAFISAVLSSAACIAYAKIYSTAFYVDFSQVVGSLNLMAASTLGCFLMALGYKLAIQWKGIKTTGWLNLAYALLSFGSIAGVLTFNLPLDTEFPEMFPGMVIPMHFFPLLSFLSILPFIVKVKLVVF